MEAGPAAARLPVKQDAAVAVANPQRVFRDLRQGDLARLDGKAVRFTGLDITVRSSDSKRSPGRLSRQGPEVLRWLLYL